jgi:DNA helicase HerA-like ATPase
MSSNAESFKSVIESGYSFNGDSIIVGASILDGTPIQQSQIKIPLKTLNRHGLIAGATGTGKTKSIQLLSEQLSNNGISVLMMDIKGDFSGIAQAGTTNKIIEERTLAIGNTWQATAFPVELMSISNQDGVRLRSTTLEFGPILISKILDLNETQQSVMSIVFKFADDENLPLVDLKDLKKVLQFISSEGKEILEKDYGSISPATIGTMTRKIVELEQQGAELFFGEPSFEVNDLLRKDENGRGYINIVRLTDIQDKPKLFSTFMLSLLAEVYANFPERGDMDRPELVIFIDEAHLVFNEASETLLEQIETIIKLIRSKGVGIFFCTQNPTDIPAAVLSQLGLKVQHALRAFTAKDRQAIKLVAQNYPITEFYKVEDAITQLGIGEAFITALNEKGIPTPLVHTLMAPPQSRMDVLTVDETRNHIQNSKLYPKYKDVIDNESAYEILNKKMDLIEAAQTKKEAEKQAAKTTTASTKQAPSTLEKMLNNKTTKSLATTATREITRGLLGILIKTFKK